MISLPLLERLQVDDYLMFPGAHPGAGLTVEFSPGLTLTLGANGLGKTTLVTMVYRLLTGTHDIPTLAVSGVMGDKSLEVKGRSPVDQAFFAQRVADGAKSALATLSIGLGGSSVVIVRQLSNLRLAALIVDDEPLEPTEEAFQSTMVRLSALASFSDWVLALRLLVFYFEGRQALVWDATAQRQLLRLLFLPPATSQEWTQLERDVLARDSDVRNLQAVLNRELLRLDNAAASMSSADEVRQSLELLVQVQRSEQAELDELSDGLVEAAEARSSARIAALTTDQRRESADLDVDRLELQAIAAAFPDSSATARYLISQILADASCLTCGTHVPQFRAELESRLSADACVICGSPVSRLPNEHAYNPRALERARKTAAALLNEASVAEVARAAAELHYAEVLERVSGLTRSIAVRKAEIEDLIRQLPPDEREVHTQRDAMSALRVDLEVRRDELVRLRAEFSKFVARVNNGIASQKEAIKAAFDDYARGFLLEACELVWQPRKDRVGQSGELVEFAAFELVMSGASFEGTNRRSAPNHVSESQREFIDLSFRMALMDVAASSGSSLVIDAPESSLDAVFVSRAANVLSNFADTDSNRLLVTSNLIDGDLIPSLLRNSSIKDSNDPRVIDLLEVAAPTAATRELNAEYKGVRTELFRRAHQAGALR